MKTQMYKLLAEQASALGEGCPAPLPALSNASALLWQSLENINWAGFYLVKGETLYLGPFQGKVACTVIPFGKGVCGTAAQTKELQLVKDVHLFPGHIACDSASNSEVVIPLVKDSILYGVLDIDSPLLERFDEEDATGLQCFCQHLLESTDWTHGIL